MNIIIQYKLSNNIDSGFSIKKYEEAYNHNKNYIEMIQLKQKKRAELNKKKAQKEKRKQAVKFKQDFDAKYEITEDNVLRYLQFQNPNIEFLTEDDMTGFMNNYINYRQGKLVYNYPFRDNSIKDQSIYWVGMCDCGCYRVVQGARVKDWNSCGCCDDGKKYLNRKIGHLTCIDYRQQLTGKHSRTLRLKCECDCGNIVIMKPSEFEHNLNGCCHKNCKYAILQREEAYKNQGENFKPIFYKGTNVGKIGRTKTNKNNSSGYLGVYYNAQMDKYLAYIVFQGKREDLGYYEDAETAYKVRMSAQNILHAKFLDEIEDSNFVQNNEHLADLLFRVKLKLSKNIDKMKADD